MRIERFPRFDPEPVSKSCLLLTLLSTSYPARTKQAASAFSKTRRHPALQHTLASLATLWMGGNHNGKTRYSWAVDLAL